MVELFPLRRLSRVVAGLAAAGLLMLPVAPSASAHTPHDDIADATLSPNFVEDGVAFSISRGILLKSVDGALSWTRIVRGLDNISDLVSIHVSPSEPDTLFLASNGDGIYKSTDQGESWDRVNAGLGRADVRLVVSSPRTSDVAFAAGGTTGLFRTSDGGSTWEAITAFGDISVRSIAFSPEPDGSVMLGDAEGGVHRSEDGGETWLTSALDGAGPVQAIAVSPAFDSDGTFFVGSEQAGIFKTTDAGSSFTAVNTGMDDLAISSVVVSEGFASDSAVWASTQDSGVFSSLDGGTTWRQTSDGLINDPQAGSPGYEDRPAYGTLSVSDDSNGRRTMLLATFNGLYLSADSGVEWRELETLSSTILVGLAVSPTYASDSTVAVTTYINGAFLSEDGGTTWTAANDGLEETTASRKAPDRIARLYGITFSPAYESDHTIFSATSSKFLRSTDGGRTWNETVPQGTKAGDIPHQFTIVVSPSYAEDETILLGDGSTGDVFISTDGGLGFSELANVGGLIRSIVVSPEFATDDTLFAGTGHGIFRSVNRGSTWEALGLKGENVGSLAVSPQFGTDQTMFAGTLAGLFITTDGGTTWERPATAGFRPRDSIEAVALSPNFVVDGTALVTARGRGLFRSTDRGKTFEPVGADLLDRNLLFDTFSKSTASPIVFSPAYASDRTVFGFSGTELLKSTDDGETWNAIVIPRTMRDGSAEPPDRGTATNRSIPWLALPAATGVLASIVAGVLFRRRRRQPS